MAITTLQADNRILLQSAKYSYLVSNYISGVSSLTITNATDPAFATDAYVLIGNVGADEAEILKISTVNSSTGLLTFTTSTKFSHSESSRVSVIPYNQVKFYYTVTETFSTGTLLATVDIQPGNWFTTYDDSTHVAGYGWFVFYNSTSTAVSNESNSLPYAGFERDTVEDILNDFFSLLNNKELKLVTRDDALSWLNEGFSLMRNKLNLSNREYSASALSTLSIVSGTSEYLLPDDFYQLVSITGGLETSDPTALNNQGKYPIDYISLREAFTYTGSAPRYYIRGKYIGILPTPQNSSTYHYMYLTKTDRVTSNSDVIDLPDNGCYVVKDFMMYRAGRKFGNPNYMNDYKMFIQNLNDMVVASVDRDAALDWCGIAPEANV